MTDAELWAGLALLVAGLCGEWCARVWRIPRITGYGLVGLLAGTAGLHLLNPSLIEEGHWLIDIALGLLLFELGSRFSLRWLKQNPWIVMMSLAESSLTFVLVLLVLKVFGVETMTASVIAGIAMSTSPAMVIQLRNELRAEGQVIERLMALSALNTIYAVVIVKLICAWAHQTFYGNVWATIAQPLYLFLGSSMLGMALALSCHALYKRFPGRNDHAFVILFGLLLLTTSIGQLFNLSIMLAILIGGVAFKNLTVRPQLWAQHFGSAGWLLTVMLFVLTTMTFRWEDAVKGGAIALVLVFVRTAAKMVGVVAFAKSSGMEWRKGLALGLSLTPMSAGAWVLVNETYGLYPMFDPHLRAIVMSAIVILQIASPVLIGRALTVSHERPTSDATSSA